MSANQTDDPRDPAAETKLTFPESWQADSAGMHSNKTLPSLLQHRGGFT